MKKIKEIKSSKIQKRNDFEPRRMDNSDREKSPIWPEEYEEQRSMNIRMKEQPLQSSIKSEKKTKSSCIKNNENKGKPSLRKRVIAPLRKLPENNIQ